MKKVIITGVTGQDGSYMAEYLLKNTDHNIVGAIRRTSQAITSNIESVINNPRFRLAPIDLCDVHSVSSLIQTEKPDYFINFGAQSFVADSWVQPALTMRTNAESLIHICEAVRNFSPECRVYSAGCHDDKSRVFTERGLKRYDEVQVGELVWTINPLSREMELKRVTKKFDSHFKGRMIHFTGLGKDMMLTPNHTVIYQSKASGKIINTTASKARDLSHFVFPRGKWIGEKLPEVIDLTPHIPTKYFSTGHEITKIKSEDLFYLIGLYIGDGSCNIIKHSKSCIANRVRMANVNSLGQIRSTEELEAMGIKKQKSTYCCPRITIDIPKSDKSWDNVKKVLDAIGVRWDLHNEIDIYFSSWGLYHWFDKCGHVSWEKKIPLEYLKYEPRLLRQLLQGILDSDGYRNKVVTTTSLELVNGLIELCSKLGYGIYFSKIKMKSTRLKDGRIITPKHQAYDVHIHRRQTHYRRRIKTVYCTRDSTAPLVDYNGRVWCLEVADNHNFLVERNGHVGFSGNSSEQWGNILYSPQDIKHPMRPRSIYGVSKCAAAMVCKVYRESFNLFIVHGILLNHESKRRQKYFVTRKITSGIAKIKSDLKRGIVPDPIELGNLDAKRDWSHSLDFVDGIWKMLNADEPKEYVLSSGETHSVREFIELACKHARLTGHFNPGKRKEDETFWIDSIDEEDIPPVLAITINPAFYRPAEVDLLLGDSTPARQELGWQPKITFNELVKGMVEHDISIL